MTLAAVHALRGDEGAAQRHAAAAFAAIRSGQEFWPSIALLLTQAEVDLMRRAPRSAAARVQEALDKVGDRSMPRIEDVDMVPNLSPQNLASTEVNKDFMLTHGYIQNDFDVQAWAAPEFLEKAAEELLEEEWTRRSMANLSAAVSLEDAMQLRLG